MTLRRMWVLSAVMATLWCGLVAICESHVDMNSAALCLIFCLGGWLALILVDLIMFGGQGENPVLHEVILYGGTWIFMCAIFFLILLGHRKLKRLTDRS